MTENIFMYMLQNKNNKKITIFPMTNLAAWKSKEAYAWINVIHDIRGLHEFAISKFAPVIYKLVFTTDYFPTI